MAIRLTPAGRLRWEPSGDEAAPAGSPSTAKRLRGRLARGPLHPRGGEDPDPRHAERALLAAARGALSHRLVPRSRGCGELRGRAPVLRRLCPLDPDRPAHAGRRVSLRRDTATHLGAPGRLGAGDRYEHRWAGRLPASAGAEMASGREGLLPSGREPERRGASVRLHGDLCVRLRRGGAVEASAAAQGPGAVRRSEEPRRARQAALAGTAGGRVLRLGEGPGGLRRHLSAHGLDGGACLPVAAQCGGARGERAVRAVAELVAPAAPAPGVGDDRCRGAVDARRRCDAGLQRQGRPGRCPPCRPKSWIRCSAARTAWCCSRASGSRWTATSCAKPSSTGTRCNGRPKAARSPSSRGCVCSPARPRISGTRSARTMNAIGCTWRPVMPCVRFSRACANQAPWTRWKSPMPCRVRYGRISTRD